MFDWDRHNLRKIRAHQISQPEWKRRFVTIRSRRTNKMSPMNAGLFITVKLMGGRLLAAVVTQRGLRLKTGTRRVKPMTKKTVQMPKFQNESEEADWWASPAGLTYVKRKSAQAQSQGAKPIGSSLVAALSKKNTVQIALRLPETDLARARKIADRKGIGYQTLLKMLVREGLIREARRV
jgi:predicted DNA binding CopG/RHH family protein